MSAQTTAPPTPPMGSGGQARPASGTGVDLGRPAPVPTAGTSLATWPVLDPERTMRQLVAEAVPLLAQLLTADGLRQANPPVWSLDPNGQLDGHDGLVLAARLPVRWAWDGEPPAREALPADAALAFTAARGWHLLSGAA